MDVFNNSNYSLVRAPLILPLIPLPIPCLWHIFWKVPEPERHNEWHFLALQLTQIQHCFAVIAKSFILFIPIASVSIATNWYFACYFDLERFYNLVFMKELDNNVNILRIMYLLYLKISRVHFSSLVTDVSPRKTVNYFGCNLNVYVSSNLNLSWSKRYKSWQRIVMKNYQTQWYSF